MISSLCDYIRVSSTLDIYFCDMIFQSQLITSKGYPCEEYTVQTADGYLLGVQRIPHGRGEQPSSRPVVFVQHGLLSSSADWLDNLVNESFRKCPNKCQSAHTFALTLH